MPYTAVKWILVIIALYSASLCWKLFQGDVLYTQMATSNFYSANVEIAESNTYPDHDVRIEILEGGNVIPTDAGQDAVNKTIRNLRLAQYKEPINNRQISNLVRHEIAGYRTGYPITVLVNYALTMSNGRISTFPDAFNLAMNRFFELTPGARLRAIDLCNQNYDRLPASMRDRVIRDIESNQLARIVYQNSYNQDLLSDLYQYL